MLLLDNWTRELGCLSIIAGSPSDLRTLDTDDTLAFLFLLLPFLSVQMVISTQETSSYDINIPCYFLDHFIFPLSYPFAFGLSCSFLRGEKLTR